MSSLNSTFVINVTFVRPEYFFITGFAGFPHTKYYFFFLCFIYAVSLLGNTFVMFMIYTDHCLHSPKYIVVFNLALTDLCVSTALVPQMMDTFLFRSHLISYEACLTNMFFVYLFFIMQSLTLTVLSYDRFVAISFPLRYNEIVTNESMLVITTISWIFVGVAILIAVIFITRLSFCKSIVINSYFCDHTPMFTLACNDNKPSSVINWILPILTFWVPILFITGTYICIGRALLQIPAASARRKAMKTCTSHLILVGMFYLPILVTPTVGSIIDQNGWIITRTLTTLLPSMLNPILYSLKTEEFTESIKMFYRRNKLHTTVRKK